MIHHELSSIKYTDGTTWVFGLGIDVGGDKRYNDSTSLILKYETHCVLLCPTALYLANPALKSILGIFLSIWLGNFLTAFGKYCGSTLGVAKLRTVSFVFVSLGYD